MRGWFFFSLSLSLHSANFSPRPVGQERRTGHAPPPPSPLSMHRIRARPVLQPAVGARPPRRRAPACAPAAPRAAAAGAPPDPPPPPPTPRPPPPAIASVRAARSAGLAASATLLGVATAAALATGALPPPPPWAGPAAGGAAAVVGLSAAAAGLILGDRLLVEADAEGLHISLTPPYDAAAHPSGRPDGRPAVAVRPTPDRGNGAFAVRPIPAGAFLGSYEGELLDEAGFWARYGSRGGTADYCMRIDRTWTVDGAQRAADTSVFSPCHINHGRASTGKANVSRVTRRGDRRVDLYAGRDIESGEELLLDYGAVYWRGRESEEIL
jgi:hypothetical protein